MNDEIDGSMEILSDGSTLITMNIEQHHTKWRVTPHEDHYEITCCSMEDLWVDPVEIRDIVEAKVELSDLLRRYHFVREHNIELFKHMIEEAWMAPRCAYEQVKEMI